MFDKIEYIIPNNVELQKQLESLSWTYGQSGENAFETCKLSTIEEKSIVLASQIKLILSVQRRKIGEYIYALKGSNRIERISDKIKLKHQDNPKLKLGSIRKIHIRPKQTQGTVYKVT